MYKRFVFGSMVIPGVGLFPTMGEMATQAIALPEGVNGVRAAWAPKGKAFAEVCKTEDPSLWLNVVEAPEGNVRWEKRIGEIPSGGFRPPAFSVRISSGGSWVTVWSPWQILVFSSTRRLAWAYPVGLGELPFLLRFHGREEMSPRDYLAPASCPAISPVFSPSGDFIATLGRGGVALWPVPGG